MRKLLHLAALAVLPLTSLVSAATRPPNIIIFFTDDQGYNDLGCFGSKYIKTPNFDRMAEEGMKFTDFYVAAPVCTPSRAGLLTGCYPQRISMMHFDGVGRRAGRVEHVLFHNSLQALNPDETLIPEILKPIGYTSGMVGKWHLGDRKKAFLPVHQGFDSCFGTPLSHDMNPLQYMRNDEILDEKPVVANLTQRNTHEAVQFIESNKDHPFFLYLAQNMPHVPLAASEKFRGKSAGGLYGDVIEELDWSMGVILQTLKDNHIDDNTLVIYCSDNGPWHIRGEDGGNAFPFRAGKGTTYEGGMREPCIMRFPGVIPPGTVCHEIASTIDILPTIAKLTGAKLGPKPIDGKDISPLMRNEPGAKTPHEAFFYYGDGKLNAVRSGKWKLKLETSLKEEGYYEQLENPDTKIPMHLYNLDVDPGEQKSVLKDHPDIVQKLLALAEKEKQELGDLRTGVKGAATRPCAEVIPEPKAAK